MHAHKHECMQRTDAAAQVPGGLPALHAQAVELDRRRQENREALTALRKQQAAVEARPAGAAKTWVKLRGVVLKLDLHTAVEVLQAGVCTCVRACVRGGSACVRGSSTVQTQDLRPVQGGPVLCSQLRVEAPVAPAARHESPPPCVPPRAEQEEVEQELVRTRAEEKRLTAMLAERGAGPASVGPAMLSAMLNLEDHGGGRQRG